MQCVVCGRFVPTAVHRRHVQLLRKLIANDVPGIDSHGTRVGPEDWQRGVTMDEEGVFVQCDYHLVVELNEVVLEQPLGV